MLRKLTHIILALVLLVSSTGVTISRHYCGGKYVSTSINKEAKACCDDDGCCENKSFHLELNDDYVSPVQLESVQAVELDVLFPILFVLNFELLDEEDKAIEAFVDSSPPPKIQTRLALLQIFLC